jgi:hypothetical protein
MATGYRVQVYWSGRAEPPARLAQQIFVFLTALPSVHEGLTGWHFEEVSTGKMVPVDSPSACQRALEDAAVEWTMGGRKSTSYAPRLFVGRADAPAVEIQVTCGIEPLPIGPVFVPNRLSLVVRELGGEERVSAAVVENVLRAAIAMFRPDFGHAGSESMPQPAEPIFSDGTPVVGWLTYLSSAYPSLPSALPAPAALSRVAGLGTLVVARPELFVDGDEEHLAPVEAVRAALEAAGVLVREPALSQPAT